MNCSNIFLDPSPRVMEIKTNKKNKWGLTKLKRFCTAKETIINKTKNNLQNGRKYATDKGLISKIYKQLIQLYIKKQTTQSNMGRRSKKTFLQRRHTDGQKAHEKMLNIANY